MAYPKKVSDEVIIEAYDRLNNVWYVAKEVGMCGQSVHERLVKLDKIHKNRTKLNDPRIFKKWRILIAEYELAVSRDGGLVELANKLGRTKNFICRKARELGLTDIKRHKHAEAAKKVGLKASIHHKIYGHPKGMLGKRHSLETKKTIGIKSKILWETNIYLNSEEHRQKNSDRMVNMRKNGIIKPCNQYSRCKRGQATVGGKTYFFRSSWEANIAAYLQFLKEQKQIKDWEFEVMTFWFDKIKRGVRSYLPDFRVINNDDSVYYIEVKGWMDDKSKTKLNRMRIYYPNIKIEVYDKKRYNAIAKQKGLFKEWGKLD